MPVKIKDNETGEVTEREVVDAREILRMGGGRYEQVPIEAGPQNVGGPEEFARRPVGANVPKEPTEEDEVPKIRNPISDQPRMAPRAGSAPVVPGARGAAFDRDVHRDQLESMTVSELKETAANEQVDLGDHTLKADIVNAILRDRAKKAKEAEPKG